MGQMVAVTEKPSSSPGIVRFELNRALTGMGHEHYASLDEATGNRPPDELARRLFSTGQIDGVHIFSNMLTVELSRGGDAAPLAEIVRTLYQYWHPGMKPPSFEDLQPAEEAAAAPAAGGDSEGADPALAAAMAVVPANLLERSRAGRERWNAKSGG